MLLGINFDTLFNNEVFWGYFWKIVVSIVLFVVMFVVAALVRKGFAKAMKSSKVQDVQKTRLSLLKSFSSATVYIVFISIIIAQYSELETLGKTILAGSGIAVLAISLAAQDAIGNVIGGFFISIFQPFKIGDVITYTDKEILGKVEEISIRHTVIRTYDNRRIIIPNGLINKQSIENASFEDCRHCIFMDLGIAYSANIGKAMDIIEDEIVHHKDYIDVRTPAQLEEGRKPVKIHVQKWDNSAIIIRAWVWGKDHDTALDMTRDLYKSVKERFDAEGVEIPYQYINVIQKTDKN